MTWYEWLLTVYGIGIVVVFIMNFVLMIATGGMITFSLVIFRAILWPFFWTSWWRGDPLAMD